MSTRSIAKIILVIVGLFVFVPSAMIIGKLVGGVVGALLPGLLVGAAVSLVGLASAWFLWTRTHVLKQAASGLFFVALGGVMLVLSVGDLVAGTHTVVANVMDTSYTGTTRGGYATVSIVTPEQTFTEPLFSLLPKVAPGRHVLVISNFTGSVVAIDPPDSH